MSAKNFIIGATLLLSHVAFSGTEGGGGGDASEIRVNEIRSDILNWINKGGAEKLSFQFPLKYEEYKTKMTEILEPKKVVIGFVEHDHETDEELKVSVDGMPKTCRGFYSRVDAKPHILCNISRFKSTDASEQYQLIHHEYAGLVGIEKNEGAASDYYLSSQLTNFLKMELIMKLSVSPKESNFSRTRIVKDDLYATCKKDGRNQAGRKNYECVIEDGKSEVVAHKRLIRSLQGIAGSAFSIESMGVPSTELGRDGMFALADFLSSEAKEIYFERLKDNCFAQFKISDVSKDRTFLGFIHSPTPVEILGIVCE